VALEQVPRPVYTTFYAQVRHLLPGSLDPDGALHLPYEASRGCWWGRRHTCRFCGLNGPALAYSERSPETVVTDLSRLLEEHPTRIVMLTDNVLPASAPARLLPALARALPDLVLCAQVRTHHRLPDILAMRRAGLRVAQAGIEALSTSLLRRLRKGVTARQNLTFLRDAARAGGLMIYWNLLHAVPGDTEQEYRQTLELIPWITHLPPPLLLAPLVIERFSPYFESPSSFGITGLRQCEYPPGSLPEHVDTTRLASHFAADYECFSTSGHPLMDRLRRAVEAWRAAWTAERASRPRLELTRLDSQRFVLTDTRPESPGPGRLLVSRAHAAALLADRRIDPHGMTDDRPGPDLDRRHLRVEADGWLVSTVIARPELVLELTPDSGADPAVDSAQVTGGPRMPPTEM
jgi:ribosomal peptide maturation radical SAM protein 1